MQGLCYFMIHDPPIQDPTIQRSKDAKFMHRLLTMLSLCREKCRFWKTIAILRNKRRSCCSM